MTDFTHTIADFEVDAFGAFIVFQSLSFSIDLDRDGEIAGCTVQPVTINGVSIDRAGLVAFFGKNEVAAMERFAADDYADRTFIPGELAARAADYAYDPAA